MGRYQALLDERAQLVQFSEDLYASLEREGREMTDVERAQDNQRHERLATVRGDIAREESIRETARAISAAAPETPHITGGHDRRADDPRGGFANLGEMALAVRTALSPGGIADDRLRIGAAPSGEMREYGATSGEGYLVPTEFRQAIWQLVFDDPVISLFTFEPTMTGAVELNTDETTPWGSSGVIAYWRAERAQMTGTRPSNQHRITRTHQLYAMVMATNELLRDAPLLNDRITNKASQAITWKAAEALIRGTGAGQPLGILTSATAIEVAKESSQAADTVVAGNVVKMFSRLIRGGGGQPFWLANPDVVPQLPLMTIGNQPVWLPPTGLVAGGSLGSLLGAPIYESDHCDTVGDVGDLILVNPAGYHAIRRTDAPEFASSIHLYFDYNETAFRWTFELGGQPFLEAAVTPPNSSNTRSHIVTLAARA